LPFERPDEYIKRSPVYFVDNLRVPILVHVATNDEDVDFVEDEQMINALRAKKPELAETKVYVDPPGGHAFQILMNPTTLEARNTPAQRDSWDRTWAFFDRTLHPADAHPATRR
jgi:dienelactone hydrolase